MPINKTGVKKDGRQQYRVRVNYTDASGKAHQIERTAYGLAEANALEQSLIAEYKDKKQTASSRMTLNELIKEYEEYHATESKRSSHDTVMKVIRLRIAPYLGDYRLDKITQSKLAEWNVNLSKTKLSDGTKKHAYSIFVALLNYAVKMEYIFKNPLTVLGNFKNSSEVSEQPEKLRYYTVEQFQKYIAVAKKHCNSINDWNFYVFFNLAFFTGARKGEINALKWSDIENNVLHIRRQITQKLKGEDVETTPKTKSSIRNLQLPKPMMEILEAHKKRQQESAPLQFSDEYRICGEKPLRDTTIDKHNRAFAEEAKLPHISIHEFRHSHASLLANNNINIQEIARRLGHSNVEITWKTYSHLYPSQEEKALEILNQIDVE